MQNIDIKTRNCIICGFGGNYVFSAKILNKYDVDYFKCPDCEAIYTQEVTWSEEAYKNALNSMDTGVMSRNLMLAEKVSDLLHIFFPENKMSAMDFGGGYGIMTRLLRDNGFDFKWYDKFAENLVAKGYEFKKGPIDVVTAFEVFEHFENPMSDLTWIAKLEPKLFIFSTLLYDDECKTNDKQLCIGGGVPYKNWWYYGFEHGQHICFYSKKTLKKIAEKFNWNYISLDNEFHIFSNSSIDLQEGIKRYKKMLRRKVFAKKISQKIYSPQTFPSLVWHDFLEQQEILKEGKL